MQKIIHAGIALLFALFLGCSSGDTTSQLKEIDELKGKGFPITAEQMESINTFIADGKRLIDQGQEKEASEALAKAIDILNMARDADIFNKAD